MIDEKLQAAGEMLKKGKEALGSVASEADKRVKENPWPYIAGTAVVALLVGFFMGKSRKS